MSDLHFTGQLKKEFFVEVVRQANELDSDLVAITGDIIDKHACLPWIPDVLGKLRSRLGEADILLVNDYGKGTLTAELLQDLIGAAREAEVPVIVDPHKERDFTRYRGATGITPNRPETERVALRRAGAGDEEGNRYPAGTGPPEQSLATGLPIRYSNALIACSCSQSSWRHLPS